MSTIEPQLAGWIDAARDALARDPHHDLPRGYREAIWRTLGPRGGLAAVTKGQRRRTLLAAAAARRVLPTWTASFPGDDRVSEALDLALKRAAGAIDARTAYTCRDRLVNEILGLDGPEDARAAAFAGTRALTAAVNDEAFDETRVALERRDADVNPDELDASYFASVAEAHGVAGHEGSDDEARQRFWTWWLDEAVPRAAAFEG